METPFTTPIPGLPGSDEGALERIRAERPARGRLADAITAYRAFRSSGFRPADALRVVLSTRTRDGRWAYAVAERREKGRE